MQGEFSQTQYTVPQARFEDANREAIVRFFEIGWQGRVTRTRALFGQRSTSC